MVTAGTTDFYDLKRLILSDFIFQVQYYHITMTIYLALLDRMTSSYLVWNLFMASSLVRRWGYPTCPTLRRLYWDINARASKENIEVHTVDTDAGVILDSQVDMLLNTVSEVTVGREIVISKFNCCICY